MKRCVLLLLTVCVIAASSQSVFADQSENEFEFEEILSVPDVDDILDDPKHTISVHPTQSHTQKVLSAIKKNWKPILGGAVTIGTTIGILCLMNICFQYQDEERREEIVRERRHHEEVIDDSLQHLECVFDLVAIEAALAHGTIVDPESVFLVRIIHALGPGVGPGFFRVHNALRRVDLNNFTDDPNDQLLTMLQSLQTVLEELKNEDSASEEGYECRKTRSRRMRELRTQIAFIRALLMARHRLRDREEKLQQLEQELDEREQQHEAEVQEGGNEA